jgi:hypothetical protein
MNPRTTTTQLFASALFATAVAFSAACGGDDSGGPTLITLKDAGTGGSASGTGGAASTGTGGTGGDGAGGDSSDAAASGGGGSGAIEADSGGSIGSDATSDAGCIVNAVTYDDYLNACPDQRVLACFTFRTTLPSQLPALP